MSYWQQQWNRRRSCHRSIPVSLSGTPRPCVCEGECIWAGSLWSLSHRYVVFLLEFRFLQGFYQRALLLILFSPSVPTWKRLRPGPSSCFNGPLRARLPKEKGVLPLSSPSRRTLRAEWQGRRLALPREEVNQRDLLSTWRTRPEKRVSKQVLFRF